MQNISANIELVMFNNRLFS